MMNIINIVCLKWGTKFSPAYVNRLYYGFLRNTTVKFNFHCFTDDMIGIDKNIIIHKLPDNKLEGWWNKLYLFSKDLPISGRIVFVDLDTLIVGNVDDILSYSTGFVGLKDLYKAAKDPNTNEFASALMSFEAGQYSHIWEGFMLNPKGNIRSLHPHGDQKWINVAQTNRLYWQDLFPNKIVSYKVVGGVRPPEASIICFHGRPSIEEAITDTVVAQGRTFAPSPWIKDYWNG